MNADLFTTLLITILLTLFEYLPPLAAHDHALCARDILHARHQLSTEHGVTVPGGKKENTRVNSFFPVSGYL